MNTLSRDLGYINIYKLSCLFFKECLKDLDSDPDLILSVLFSTQNFTVKGLDYPNQITSL